MAEYGKTPEPEPTPKPSPAPKANAETPDEKSKQEKLANDGCFGCLSGCLSIIVLLLGFAACRDSLRPENLVKKCEEDLQDRYGLVYYSRLASGFTTLSKPVEPTMIQVIEWGFFYQKKSIPGLEDAEPTYQGRATCRIDIKAKKVRSSCSQC